MKYTLKKLSDNFILVSDEKINEAIDSVFDEIKDGELVTSKVIAGTGSLPTLVFDLPNSFPLHTKALSKDNTLGHKILGLERWNRDGFSWEVEIEGELCDYEDGLPTSFRPKITNNTIKITKIIRGL